MWHPDKDLLINGKLMMGILCVLVIWISCNREALLPPII
jgi:hypothetical protein